MTAIPIGTSYVSKISGRGVKAVTCERCGHEYVYMLERTAYGDSFSPLFIEQQESEQEAKREASEKLKDDLSYFTLMVPCPKCAWFQKKMVWDEKWGRYKHLLRSGLVLTTGGFMIFVLTHSANTTVSRLGMICFLGGLLALILKYVLCALPFRPNTNELLRKRYTDASPQAIGRAELEELARSKGIKLEYIQEATAARSIDPTRDAL